MKKVLLTLLVVVLLLGALGAAGYAGYQYGYRQGVLSASSGNVRVAPWDDNFGPHGMPMHNFGFNRGFGHDGFGMMLRGFGLGFFSPLAFVGQLLFWGLLIWGIYMLVTRSGWRLTRTTPAVPSEPPASNVENKES